MKKHKQDWKQHLKWAIPLVLILWIIISYNSLVSSQVLVDTAWGQVEVVYQRRADLIPRLIETVKGARDFEKGVLIEITKARSQWAAAKTPSDQVKAANNLEAALSQLLFVAENYPELKTNQNFLALQDELAGSENRISVERQRYNTAVGLYNTKIRRFPSNIVAGVFGFDKKDFFAAEKGSEKAPDVKF